MHSKDGWRGWLRVSHPKPPRREKTLRGGDAVDRDQLKTFIRGPVAAVPTPFDADYRLDLGVWSELITWWVQAGLGSDTTVIKIAAAVGEGPDLDEHEWPRLLATAVEAAKGRAAIVCGLKAKDTLHTIEDAKRAAALGAIGLQIDLPFFHHPTQSDLVRFFSDVSDRIDIGIMIYNTWWFGCPSISAESVRRLADAERVVAIKWNVPPDEDYDQMRDFAHLVNVIDNSLQPVRCYKNGGRGYISQTIAAHPAHDLHVWRLLEEGNFGEAQARFEHVCDAFRNISARSDQLSGGYRLIKALMSVVGHPVGPPRPPTIPMNPYEITELRDIVAKLGWPIAATHLSRVGHVPPATAGRPYSVSRPGLLTLAGVA